MAINLDNPKISDYLCSTLLGYKNNHSELRGNGKRKRQHKGDSGKKGG